MKVNLMLKAVGHVLGRMVLNEVPDKAMVKNTQKEYERILVNASDIGEKNRLLSSYSLAAYFIALNRCSNAGPEVNIGIMERQMRKSKLLKAFMGSGSHYFSEKAMESRRQWSKETHEKKYKNDWVVDVVEKGPGFQFGFNYTECGVCKLCRDEGCPELAKYLCSLDYMLVEIMGIGLHRTKTLAEGGDCCDFRFYDPNQNQ